MARSNPRGATPPLKPDTVMADYYRGDNTFLLNFSYPFKIDPETGELVIREGEHGKRIDTFNGIYRIVRVTHNFSHGEFRQTISANRLPLIDVARALNYSGDLQVHEDPEGNWVATSPSDMGTAGPSSVPGGTPAGAASASKRVKAVMSDPKKKAIADEIYDTARARGYSHEQAVGVVSNAIAESGLNPTIVADEAGGHKSYGLFQLHDNGVGKGQSVSYMKTVQGNTDLILDAADRYGHQFKQATTVEQAASAFCKEVERPANMNQRAAERAQIATEVAKYKLGGP